MAEALTIDPAEPLNKGLDYAALKAEGTALVQQLSGAIWTDYNEHDPGVTTLEQLCYALTELSYRAELPLEDLLVSPRTGRIDPRRQALFVPRRILPCNPVTADDYRKLVVDRVPGVANAWFVPREVTDREVKGLYDVFVYAPGAEDCPPGPAGSPDAVRDEVRQVYARHRSLCEDLAEIVVLRPSPVVVRADVTLEEARTPEAVLAGVLFDVGRLFAPELRRTPLKALVDLGLSSDRIFNGPLLRNGFIADAELQPRARAIPVQDVVRAVVRSPGVAGAARVRVEDPVTGQTWRGSQKVPVPEQGILQVDTNPNPATGAFSIRLYKNGIEYKPDAARVRRELDKLWAAWRRTYPLSAQYDEFFGFPQGRRRDVEAYYSVQNQYPNVYGINSYGLPAGASAPRRGQAKQLKGYLLAFEQLLADYFAQLARARDLFSTDRRLRHTYFWQYLDRAVPDVAPLLKPGDDGYHGGLPRLVHSQDDFVARRNRFLEFLLALYAETLDADALSTFTCSGGQDDDSGRSLMAARLALLRRLVASTHDRGRGFDYLAGPSLRNVAGMVIRSRIQLGMDAFDHRPLLDLLDEQAVDLAEADAGATLGRPLSRHADHIREHFAPLPPAGETGAGRAAAAQPPPGLLRGQSVTEAFVQAGGRLEHCRIGSLPGETGVALVCKSPAQAEWRLVGKYADEDAACAAAYALVELLRALGRRCQQLYVVEHTLLRFGAVPPQGPEDDEAQADEEGAESSPPQGFLYSFTVTAVISTCPEQRDDPGYRRFAREVLRQNAPAHVALETCFLGACEMRVFEARYWEWREALRHGDRQRLARASARLRRLLRRCARR